MNYADLTINCIIVFSFGLLLWSINMNRATKRTSTDRMGMLEFFKTSGTLPKYHHILDDVDWDAHWKSVFWFRNPWRLYPSSLLSLMMRHEFISLGVYDDAIMYARAREAEMLDRIEHARKAVEDATHSNGRGSDLPHNAFRNE